MPAQSFNRSFFSSNIYNLTLLLNLDFFILSFKKKGLEESPGVGCECAHE
uniref:Uncharacterized protein n=1 Tax=Anguilla anguilla TaxID=7936 RepID=A0A0E9V9I9_ANGAN